MRILFFSFPYASAPGGGERYTEQTVAGLLEAGHDVSLVSSSRALLDVFMARKWPATSRWCGVEPVTTAAVLLFPFTAPFISLFLIGLLAQYRLRGAKKLVCLSLTDKLLATLPARLLGYDVIWVEHLMVGRSLKQNPLRPFYAALSRLVTLVTVSEASAASFAGIGVPDMRIKIIAPGVVPQESAPVRRTLRPPIIGAVARLSKEKNVALLLRAFAIVLREKPEVTLQLYGDGPERENLERLTDELGLRTHVAFFGYVAGTSRSCGFFDVLAVPSSRESFGLAALEAMSCSVPVVATRVGGLPEVIADGETGLLVAPDDPQAMAEALLKLLRDPALAARLGAAGRARATDRFNARTMQDAWKTLCS